MRDPMPLASCRPKGLVLGLAQAVFHLPDVVNIWCVFEVFNGYFLRIVYILRVFVCFIVELCC